MQEDIERRRGILVERTTSKESIKFYPLSVQAVSYLWGVRVGQRYDAVVPLPIDEVARIVIRGELMEAGDVLKTGKVAKQTEIVLPDSVIDPVVVNVGPSSFQIDLTPAAKVDFIHGFPDGEPLYIGEDALGRSLRARFFELQAPI